MVESARVQLLDSKSAFNLFVSTANLHLYASGAAGGPESEEEEMCHAVARAVQVEALNNTLTHQVTDPVC